MTAVLRKILLGMVLLWAASPLLALGKPDWAKPYLLEPTPSGPYIAPNDTWVVVHGEAVVGIQADRFLEVRVRLVLENLSDRPETFTVTLLFDEGQNELKDMALNVERVLWHEINLNRNAVRASVREQAQIVVASAEDIEPHKRVVFEYTLTDRLELTPWAILEIPRSEPVARMVFRVDPLAATQGLRFLLQAPGDEPLPRGFARGEDGSWTVTAVPAFSRMTTRNLTYQPASSELFPLFVTWLPGSAAESFGSFATSYRKAWDERAATIDADQVRTRVASLTSGATTPLERARRLAGFVQHDILYDDSNATSVDAWLPLATQETLRSLKADCKGKVMLLQALLRAAGIDSVPILLRNSSDYYRWRGRPAGAFFNHVMLAVKLPPDAGSLPATMIGGPATGLVLFDPTSSTAAFGGPLPGFEGVPALYVGDAADPVFDVHTQAPSVATTRVELELSLDASGTVQGKLRAESNGGSPLIERLSVLRNPEDVRKAVLGAFSRQQSQVKLTECTVKRAGDDGRTQAALESSFEVPGCLQDLASSALLPSPLALGAMLAGLPNGFTPAQPGKPEDTVKLEPPWNARLNTSGVASVTELTVTLSLPPGLTFSPPAPREEKHPWVTYSSSWTVAGERRFVGSVHMEVPRGEWPAADRKARLQLMDELLSGLYAPILLRRTPV